MLPNLSMANLAKWRERYQAAVKRGSSIRRKAQAPVKRLLHTGLGFGANAGTSYLVGRYGHADLVGAPVELLGAVGAHAGGILLGTETDMGGIAHTMGDGMLTAFGGRMAYAKGIEDAAKEVDATAGEVYQRRLDQLNDDGTDPEEEEAEGGE